MKVDFGKYKIQIKEENQRKYVYDIVRKNWVVSHPEEEVRQLWLHYLTQDKQFSISNIAVEKGFYINERLKRFDICVYDQQAKPYILIECKAPNKRLDKMVLEQLARYNLEIDAKIFIITNGVSHIGVAIKNHQMIELETFDTQ